MAYLRAIRYPVAGAIFLSFVVTHVLTAGANVWLSLWSNDVITNNGTQSPSDRDYRLGVYGALGIAQGRMIYSLRFFRQSYSYLILGAVFYSHRVIQCGCSTSHRRDQILRDSKDVFH